MNHERTDHSHARMATLAIAEHDAEMRFRIRAEHGRGRADRSLKLLRKASGGVRQA